MVGFHPFANIPQGELETLNELQAQYANDTSPDKLDLMAGVYRTEQGTPFVLPAVKLARQRLYENPAWDHEYPPSHLGTKGFRSASEALFFGQDSRLVQSGCISSMQTLGASGACHMGAAFLKSHYEPFQNGHPGKVYIPKETWVNHPNVFHHVGLETEDLPWFDFENKSLSIDALIASIDILPSQSVILLQTAGNNPTGCDPSPSQWHSLADAFVRGGHFAFLDAAYPGFVTGDVERDCLPIRIFAEAGIPLLLAATYGKAFGLYGERVGILSATLPNRDVTARAERQMKLLARAETGAQPAFGASLVEIILSDQKLKNMWKENVKQIAQQLTDRRIMLRREIETLGTPGDWSYITNQVGMFLYTGFSDDQIRRLREEHHVYLQDTSRLAISSLQLSQIPYIAKSIHAVM
ncbi:aspartate aminotransferase [Xylariales sp. PMI_506]|nr:aspartate aminotransferase [Xylariales sp. PMI_506]